MLERALGRIGVLLCAVVALLAGVVLTGAGSTSAAWTDSATIPGTSLASGRLDLEVDGHDAVTDYQLLGLSLLVPGRTTASVLAIGNAGDADLAYTVATSGTDPDGAHLLDALALKVTAATTVTTSSSGPVCGGAALPGSATSAGGPLVATPRTLARGATESICVQVGLPSTAPETAAGGATDLTLRVSGTSGGWSDSVAVAGTQLSAAALTAPTLSCGSASLLSITVSWTAVPGATAYRVHSGLLGATVTTVPAGTLSATYVGTSGLAWVQAVLGSEDWVSPESAHRAYSAITGLGTCS